MDRSLILTGLAAILLASSCDKPRRLINERANIEAEIQRANEEMRSIDAKFEALLAVPVPYGMTLDRQLEEAVKKNADLEAELYYLNKKCAAAEANLSEIRPRLDTYKAKYLH